MDARRARSADQHRWLREDSWCGDEFRAQQVESNDGQRQSFAAVTRQRVCDLVRHDDGDSRFAFTDRQDALVKRDFAAR